MTISGKTILVTGGTGQLAGAVARGLVGPNEVIAMARFTLPGTREALEAAGVRTVYGDFVTQDWGGAPERVDYVFHAAANTRPSSADEGMRDNAEGTGFLMHRYRDAKAFLHVSATGVYAANADPHHVFTEDEPLGGMTDFSPQYGVTKIAGEGVARTMCQILGLPTIIGRMNVAYGGPYFDGGLPGRQLDAILADEPIRLSAPHMPIFQQPIHEDDITAHVLPMFEAATVPATIINWSGDEPVEIETWVRHLYRLVGKEPNIIHEERSHAGSWIGDQTRRQALDLHCKVHWKEGMKRMIAARRPEVRICEVD
jgi:nucleoside-diphosphate-sugar epimerase